MSSFRLPGSNNHFNLNDKVELHGVRHYTQSKLLIVSQQICLKLDLIQGFRQKFNLSIDLNRNFVFRLSLGLKLTYIIRKIR